MPLWCTVCGCGRNAAKPFHRLPRHELEAREWLRRAANAKYPSDMSDIGKIRGTVRVCHRHFSQSCLISPQCHSIRGIKERSMPTLHLSPIIQKTLRNGIHVEVPETTLDMKIKVENETTEESQSVNIEEDRVDPLSNEAHEEGGTQFSYVNVEPKMEPLDDDDETKATNLICSKQSFKCSVESSDSDVIDAINIKVETDDTNDEEMSNDLNSVPETTLNMNIKVENEFVDECLEVNWEEGSTELSQVNVKTEIDIHEDSDDDDDELQAANQDCHKKWFKCSICHQNFTKRLSLEAHFREAHYDVNPYKCNWCTKTFSHIFNYNEHRWIHTVDKPYNCNLCEKSFAHESAYRSHSRIHTGEKPYKCDSCGKAFAQRSAYNVHRRIHTGEKPYKCDFCEKAFIQKSAYEIHRRIHTGEKPFKCDLCEKAFSNETGYNVHRRVHTGEKPYKCDFCEKAFSNKSTYDRHRRIHTGEKPYKCDLCEKVFTQNSAYNVHRQIHTGEKHHECDICGKRFSRKSAYNEHRRIHTSEKPYKCDLCPKAFKQIAYYHKHRKLMH